MACNALPSARLFDWSSVAEAQSNVHSAAPRSGAPVPTERTPPPIPTAVSASATASALFGKAERLGHAHPDWAGNTRAPEAAIPARVLGQVLLVVILGVIERAGLGDFGGDGPVPGRGERSLERVARCQRSVALGRRRPVNGGAVLGPAVV